MDIRNYVLARVKPQGFYKGKKIIDCGITGTCNEYWLELVNEENINSEIVKVQRPAKIHT